MQPTQSLRLLVLAGLTTIVLATSCAPAPELELSDADRERLTAEATAFLEAYATTLEQGESEAIRELFVPDERFRWFTDGREAYTSADDVVESVAALSSQGIVFRTEYSNIDAIALTSRLVFISVAFETNAEIATGGGFAFSGWVTMLLERFEYRWRVVSGHTSTPSPPAPEGGSSY